MKKTKEFFELLYARKTVFISFLVIVLIILIAVLAPVLTPYGPYDIDLKNRLSGMSAAHLLGTDNQGRDLLTRMFYGTRSALLIAVASIVVGGVIGVFLGMIAGYFGKWVDYLVMRFTETLLAVPGVILSMAIMLVLGQSTLNLVIAIAISTIPTYIRVMRSQVMSVRTADYIASCRILGGSDWFVMMRHILPNAISPIIVTATMNIGNSILSEATLSFLGLGIPVPKAAWGSMVSEGFGILRSNPRLSIVPGIAILIVVLAFNIFGDGIRDILDPRIKNNI